MSNRTHYGLTRLHRSGTGAVKDTLSTGINHSIYASILGVSILQTPTYFSAMMSRRFAPHLLPERVSSMWTMMRVLTLSLFVLSLGGTPYAVAAPAQQNKMKACNDQANTKGLGEGKGDERKAFMKECLSAKSEKSGGGKESQQNKMKTCNKEAGEKELKGEARKKFMSDCLSA